MKVNDYGSIQEYYEKKLEYLLSSLPNWAKKFITDNSASFSTRTSIAYTQELITFLSFMAKEIFKVPCSSFDITIEQFSHLSIENLHSYLNSFNEYVNNYGHYIQMGDKAMNRKIAIIKSLYNYLYRNRKIINNIGVYIKSQKINPIQECRLSNQNLCDAEHILENKKYSLRNNAILQLLKDTGMRIVECVSLNRNDINYDTGAIKFLRKKQYNCVYITSETKEMLKKYVESTPTKNPDAALFLSSRKQRISIRMIEVMLKNIANELDINIRPNTLRQYCGTQLFKKVRDPYLVANYLGYSYQGLLLDKIHENIEDN